MNVTREKAGEKVNMIIGADTAVRNIDPIVPHLHT